ncbi:response regulator [Heliophilum fasciatum]|uniref:Stage 0 sporulation protein A homolog n=1 Tax=Heliophilum fasciatum TaxID=35700 RepID=A0A4R2RG05_9FIRM|nr:two-component system response regulator [Heliophilum fasciatum]MCW2278687.1 putative two-component system response regulator [Heliophilum fasciatum]TCP62592.1 putative two-component system response regulator [Heliophilum fasciatum]
MLNPDEKKTILVVDDTPDNLALMSALLKDEYKVKVANSGEKALRIAGGEKMPDLILLDIMMPVMDGYEVCRRLKADERTKTIPVIFLTAKSNIDDEQKGLELGAVDYITKPISPPIVLARLRTHMQLKETTDILRDQNQILERKILKRTQEIQEIQDATILMMTSLAETRDNETGNHIQRTQYYVQALARRLQAHPRFRDVLTDGDIEMLFKCAPLHDIGKVGIPDRVLLKPGRLTEEEFTIIKTHAIIGRDAIEHAETQLGRKVAFLQSAKEIALHHHEKWDGTGYPDGLSGDSIPVFARIMAVADVYDALITRRIYKPAMMHHEAVAVITDGKGTHFDPDIVDAFLEAQAEFHQIAARFVDAAQAPPAEALST